MTFRNCPGCRRNPSSGVTQEALYQRSSIGTYADGGRETPPPLAGEAGWGPAFAPAEAAGEAQQGPVTPRGPPPAPPASGRGDREPPPNRSSSLCTLVLYPQSSIGTDGGLPHRHPGPRAYRMHTSHFGPCAVRLPVLLRGPLFPSRRPRKGGDPALPPAAAAGSGPSPCPLPEGEGLPGVFRGRVSLLSVMGAGATPASARAGGRGYATPCHRAQMCESGRPSSRGHPWLPMPAQPVENRANRRGLLQAA